jgi:hypothetical protein
MSAIGSNFHGMLQLRRLIYEPTLLTIARLKLQPSGARHITGAPYHANHANYANHANLGIGTLRIVEEPRDPQLCPLM